MPQSNEYADVDEEVEDICALTCLVVVFPRERNKDERGEEPSLGGKQPACSALSRVRKGTVLPVGAAGGRDCRHCHWHWHCGSFLARPWLPPGAQEMKPVCTLKGSDPCCSFLCLKLVVSVGDSSLSSSCVKCER